MCDIDAFPPPTINWKHGEDIINNNSTFQISHFASADERTTSTLRVSSYLVIDLELLAQHGQLFQIVSVGPKQFGLYTCEAANRHGSKSQTVELYETQSPICPPLCGSTDLNDGGTPSAGLPLTSLTILAVSTAVMIY